MDVEMGIACRDAMIDRLRKENLALLDRTAQAAWLRSQVANGTEPHGAHRGGALPLVVCRPTARVARDSVRGRSRAIDGGATHLAESATDH